MSSAAKRVGSGGTSSARTLSPFPRPPVGRRARSVPACLGLVATSLASLCCSLAKPLTSIPLISCSARTPRKGRVSEFKAFAISHILGRHQRLSDLDSVHGDPALRHEIRPDHVRHDIHENSRLPQATLNPTSHGRELSEPRMARSANSPDERQNSAEFRQGQLSPSVFFLILENESRGTGSRPGSPAPMSTRNGLWRSRDTWT